MSKIFSRYIRTFAAFSLALGFAVSSVLSASASPATRERHRQLQQQHQDAQRELRTQQNLLGNTRHEMSELMLEMQALDQEMGDVAEALEGIELAFLDAQIRIADAEDALQAARDNYDSQFETLRSRVRVMHEEGSLAMFEVLFQAESITDFFARWEFMRVTAQFDRDLLESIQETEHAISSHIEDLSRWSMMVETLQFQKERTQENLEFLYAERTEWFERLAEDEAMLAELFAIAEHEERMAASAFGDIQAQLRREEDQIARERAATAHSERLARLNNFDGQFMWPIPSHGRITSGFGTRFHPILRRYRHHSGIDVGAPTGTRLYAAADGYVRFAGWSGGYGNTVIIDHGNGYSTLYAHNSRNRVTTGQFVTRGQHIADVGSTGMSTGPHLHFEIRINNVAVNPANYLPI
ncbi:MAG: peptidoglycan DD-metalloendopeptidase family protein [Defluviitaleaceae bacterium]|nr:peptidoglycan DD-metalloendopeptidase family protein [Defluviitaleaceae bacterium]